MDEFVKPIFKLALIYKAGIITGLAVAWVLHYWGIL